jgi:hypothetical protein
MQIFNWNKIWNKFDPDKEFSDVGPDQNLQKSGQSRFFWNLGFLDYCGLKILIAEINPVFRPH